MYVDTQALPHKGCRIILYTVSAGEQTLRATLSAGGHFIHARAGLYSTLRTVLRAQWGQQNYYVFHPILW